MGWLAFVVVVLGTTYFAIHHRGFRRGLLYALLGIVTLAAVGGVVGYFYNQHEEQQHQIARNLIRPDQLEITDATLSIGTLAEMKALVANGSPHRVAELAVKVTVLDCPANPFDKFDPPPPPGYEPAKKGEQWREDPVLKCAAVGQDIAKQYRLNIPSGQKRAFKAYVHLDNLPPLKPHEWSWHYSIVEIVAARE